MEEVKEYAILIVDDIFLNRKLARAIMQGTPGISFFEAEDGVQAMEIMEKHVIDLVILDIMMPNKDGFEVLMEMRECERLEDIPVFVYSAIDRFDEITKAFELGAIDYFVKPLTPQQMKVILPIKIKNALLSYEQKRLLESEHKRMQRELKFANIFQQSLVPKVFTGKQVSMYGCYLACDEMGGDIYDCIEKDGVCWFIMADVSGHGLVAAMLSSMIKLEFQNCISYLTSPKDVLKRMNEIFLDVMQGNNYFTAFIGKLEKSVLTVSNAGHPYPFYYSQKDNSISNLECNGFMVGGLENVSYDEISKNICKGDKIFLYTDGLLENSLTTHKDWQKVYNEIKSYIEGNMNNFLLQPESFLCAIVDFCLAKNQKQADDIAVMLVGMI